MISVRQCDAEGAVEQHEAHEPQEREYEEAAEDVGADDGVDDPGDERGRSITDDPPHVEREVAVPNLGGHLGADSAVAVRVGNATVVVVVNVDPHRCRGEL